MSHYVIYVSCSYYQNMVVKNITNFLDDSDKYGHNVGDRALQAGDGLFK